MSRKVPPKQNKEELYQLSKEELVEIINALQLEVARLKEIVSKDSKTSSKPPSQDIIKKSEKKKSALITDSDQTKRKPGGQPGHEGKTRKGFGRVDRIEILRPEQCASCGGIHFNSDTEKVEIKQVAQFVANPIEVVEYHRVHKKCNHCGIVNAANWSDEIIPGQDLGVRLQALIGWLGNYAHMPYTKIRELIQELGQIDIGEGTLVKTNQRVAQAIERPVEELENWVKTEQPNIHVDVSAACHASDKTPWTVKGIKEWLWVAANKECRFISCSRCTLTSRA